MSKPFRKKLKSTLIFCLLGAVVLFFVCRIVDKKLVYRTPYFTEVNCAAEEFGVDKWLIYAVMKAESGFRSDTISGKGAVGLMQLLPSTAQYVAQKLNENYDQNALLTPSVNIRYGTWYLSYLLKKFEQKAALAAYNAGEGRVSAWLKNSAYSTDGKTLICIPYRETELYVSRVQKNIKKYKKYHG